jgi:hypothetical protein
VDIDIDIPQLPSLVKRYGAGVAQIVQDEHKRAGDRAGAIVVRRMVAKVRSKRVAASLRFATEGAGFAFETKVHTAMPLGRWLEEGTGIYGPKGAPITPKRAKVLRFEVGGQTVFARSVKGMPGDRWFMGSWEASKPEVRREFAQVPKRIVNRITKGG